MFGHGQVDRETILVAMRVNALVRTCLLSRAHRVVIASTVVLHMMVIVLCGDHIKLALACRGVRCFLALRVAKHT